MMKNGYIDYEGRLASVLQHGTGFWMQGSANQGLIYGDFYLLEALLKAKAMGYAEELYTFVNFTKPRL